MTKLFRAIVGTVAAVTLAAGMAGCSGRAQTEASDADEGGLVTGPGVTADIISLGVLNDLSGPFATPGKAGGQGMQLAADQINDDGGICGRDLELVVKDTSYDVQKAVTGYSEMSNSVAAVPFIVGTPMVVALATQLEQDKMLAAPASGDPSLLGNTSIVMPGITYPIDALNQVGYMIAEKGLKDGDAIGHIALEGGLGDGYGVGLEEASVKHDFAYTRQSFKGSDTDLTPQVIAVQNAGAKAIFFNGPPSQLVSLVNVAASRNFDVPIISFGPAFSPALLEGPSSDFVLKNVTFSQFSLPLSADLPEIKTLVETWSAEYPDSPALSTVSWQYGNVMIFADILKQACENGDMSREGVSEAYREITGTDGGGMVVPLDFSTPGKSPGYQTNITEPSAEALGGLALVEQNFSSDEAKAYYDSH